MAKVSESFFYYCLTTFGSINLKQALPVAVD